MRQASDRFYRELQYGRLVICFSEDRVVGGLKYARLVAIATTSRIRSIPVLSGSVPDGCMTRPTFSQHL
mgnify:CR=1 FL=1